jgi:phosphatidylserine/phosphatidylglycerophosphate/cardiolipin synthase-like enzyme
VSGLTPEDWFLTSNETSLQPAYTSGNAVSALVDGQAYLARLRDRLSAVNPRGFIHLAGWRMTPRIRLLGDLPNSPSIRDVVIDRANAGATVRLLLWFVPGSIGDFGAGHGPENLEMSQIVEGVGGDAVLDDRLPPGKFASHHQKFIILGDATSNIAFVGGIDIAPDRWDRPQHDDPLGRQRELFDGWHDVQAQVEGPAVSHLWDTFTERWNDPRDPNAAPLTVGNSPPTPILLSERPSPTGTGSCHVQVLRTFACKSQGHAPNDDNFFPFAPNGERTYEEGLVRAIDAAERFIYLEDQYFWPCRVVDTLAAAVARGVSVILVLTHRNDVEGLAPYHNFLRQSCIDQLQSADPSRVFAFHLQQNGRGGDDIYVHAKTMVIDDRYAVIGSANINRRSMTTDTEIAIAVVDSTAVASVIGDQPFQACDFAKNYRIQLWAEHLGSQIDDPLNGDGSPAGWPTTLGQQRGQALLHQVPTPRFCRPSIIPFTFMNSETICP